MTTPSDHVNVPLDLLRDLADPGACLLDHDGNCQTHNFTPQAQEECPQKRLKRLLGTDT